MLITLEGIEGSGKSTQVRHLVDFMREMGYECLVTREPGGTRLGQKIRTILLDPANTDVEPLAELLLYAADRAQHIQQIISPALAKGMTVICDRFCDATTVYQGYARGLDLGTIDQLHRIVLNGLIPDLTLLFDLPVEIGLSRAFSAVGSGDRRESETRFEQEALAFHERVRNGYLSLARLNPERFRILNAARAETDVRHQMIHVVRQHAGRASG
ncbi:MAG: dTMP kinase [Thermodesulfobacteriota bacterium]